MEKLLGVLLLMTGVIFPMVLVGWLAFRMSKKPSLAPQRIGLILAINFVLPVGLILLGLGLMAPTFGGHAWVQLAWMISLAAAAVMAIILGVSRGRRTG